MFLELAQVDTYQKAPEIYQRGLEEVQRHKGQELYREGLERFKKDPRFQEGMKEAEGKLKELQKQAVDFQKGYKIEAKEGGGFMVVPREKPLETKSVVRDFQGTAYLFVSSSMGEGLLKSYAKQIEQMGLTNKVIMVMRGCIGGCRRIKPTLDFISRVLDINEKGGIKAQIWIDPLLFRRYNVNSVPCFVVDSSNKPTEVSVDEKNFKVVVKKERAKMVCGDWSLQYLMDEYFERR